MQGLSMCLRVVVPLFTSNIEQTEIVQHHIFVESGLLLGKPPQRRDGTLLDVLVITCY